MHTHYTGKYLAVHQIDHWEFVRRPQSNHAVGILAITEQDEVVLISQYRIPVQAHVLELPAGIVGDEADFADETLAQCAHRELLEETGYHAGSITHLIKSPTSAGMTSELTHLYLATQLEQRHAGGGVDGEDITVHHIPRADLPQFLQVQQRQHTLIDFKIHAALQAATPHLS